MDQQEQKIVSELESIEKEIAERPDAPQRSLSFNDPLTNMHYDTLDVDETISDPLSAVASQENSQKENDPPNPSVAQRLSQRSQNIEEYRRSLKQFSYNMVTSVMQPSPRKKERGQCMTGVDQDQIKTFIFEFAVRGLLPHIEKLMRNLSEQVKTNFNTLESYFFIGILGGYKNKKCI